MVSFNFRLDISIPGTTSGDIAGLLRRGALFGLGDDSAGLTGKQAVEEMARRMCKQLSDNQGEREADNSDDRNNIDSNRNDTATREAAILARRLARREQSDRDWA